MSFELHQEKASLQKRLRAVNRQLRKSKGLPAKKKGVGVRLSDRDEAEKQRRGYTDPRSFVRLDGSEKLAGIDWIMRKKELMSRSGGTCEHIFVIAPLSAGRPLSVRCLAGALDPHHVIKRWPHRDDRLSNLLHLCRPHHEALDPRKVRWSK